MTESFLENENESCCFEIRHSTELGRYLVAKRDIEPLELVIREKPLACAPADETLMCLGCCAKLSSSCSNSMCSRCKWPVCDSKCEVLSHHSSNECHFFAKYKIPAGTLPYPHLRNETIFVIRCLLIKQKDPKSWNDVILKFEHHNSIRQSKPECVGKDRKLLANLNEIKSFSKEDWVDAEEEEVIRISGVINVNAFSSTKLEDECSSRRVKRRVTICQCLYPTATLLAHQCVPNASWSVAGSPHFEQTIRTTVPIKKGEKIAIAYVPQEIMFPTMQRQISSNDIAHFMCHCYRCQDKTELGTFLGAMKCDCLFLLGDNGSELGFLLPVDPVDPESSWVCQNVHCKATKTAVEVVKVLYQIENQFYRIKNALYPVDVEVEELEDLYRESLEKYLHKNHYLLLEISFQIVTRRALSIYCLDMEQLHRFLFHCQSWLSISSILSPGYCRSRALIQFFASQAMMVKARKLMKTGSSSSKTMLDLYNSIYELQKEALLYFKSEDENESGQRRGFNQYVLCTMEEMEECLKGIANCKITS